MSVSIEDEEFLKMESAVEEELKNEVNDSEFDNILKLNSQHPSLLEQLKLEKTKIEGRPIVSKEELQTYDSDDYSFPMKNSLPQNGLDGLQENEKSEYGDGNGIGESEHLQNEKDEENEEAVVHEYDKPRSWFNNGEKPNVSNATDELIKASDLNLMNDESQKQAEKNVENDLTNGHLEMNCESSSENKTKISDINNSDVKNENSSMLNGNVNFDKSINDLIDNFKTDYTFDNMDLDIKESVDTNIKMGDETKTNESRNTKDDSDVANDDDDSLANEVSLLNAKSGSCYK